MTTLPAHACRALCPRTADRRTSRGNHTPQRSQHRSVHRESTGKPAAPKYPRMDGPANADSVHSWCPKRWSRYDTSRLALWEWIGTAHQIPTPTSGTNYDGHLVFDSKVQLPTLVESKATGSSQTYDAYTYAQ